MSDQSSGSNDGKPFPLNGIDALTGHPLWPSRSAEQLTAAAMAEYDQTPSDQRVSINSRAANKLHANYGFDVDHLDVLAEARWGLVVPVGDTEIRNALKDLIDWRASQIGADPRKMVYEVEPGTSAITFLRDHGVEPGLGAVANVPYYLLIAGDPQHISFRFQTELNSDYATGRLHFDSLDDYAAYAAHLVNYEKASSLANPREAVFWAPEREDDPATSLSAPLLVQPLYDQLDPNLNFDKRLYRGAESSAGTQPASRDNLRAILATAPAPSLLFTASHGLGHLAPYTGQSEQHGALVCQEYAWDGPLARNAWYGAEDLIKDNADVRGMVHFAFACFGAGTPESDDYGDPGQPPQKIAEQAFVAALPRQLLTRGALAFIGHIERAWSYSFQGTQMQPMNGIITPQEAFKRATRRILRGLPIGHALRDEYDRSLFLSSSLLETIRAQRANPVIPALAFAQLWTERNDARSYMVIGDPAARLRVDLLQKSAIPRMVAGVALPAQPQTNVAPPPPTPAGALTASVAVREPPAASELAMLPGAEQFLPPLQVPTGDPVTATGKQQPAGSNRRITSATNQESASSNVRALNNTLQDAWTKQMLAGFNQNNQMFKAVLNAFMKPYWLTVWMYVLMFIVGLGGFVAAAALVVQQQLTFAAIFGGLSVVSFLTFFISGPLRSLEQNLNFIATMGIVYNTYWTQLMYANDAQTVQRDLAAITATAIRDLNRLATLREKQAALRPGLQEAATSDKENK